MLTKKHILEIKSCDQNEIDETSNLFLNYLENDYLEFRKNWTESINEFKKYEKKSNKKGVYFTPEKVLIKSPITILDSPWGIGKTYFLENTCKLVSNEKIKTREIESIIIIDALKFSICNSIPTEFIEELMLKFSWKNKAIRIVKKCFCIIFNIYFLSRINQKYNLLLSKLLYKKPTHEKAIKILNKTFSKPTLLIIDNIERMNEKSWEIIRTIQKLTILDNFIFLLPINKNVLNKNFEEKNSEWIIEKFINLPYYEFKQNFSGMLKKYGMNKEQSEFINEYLKTPIDNKNKKILTLRQLETNLLNLNVEKIKNKGDISCLREISSFWNNDIKINEILKNKISDFIFCINKLSSLINDAKLKIQNYLYLKSIYNSYEWTNFSKLLLEIDEGTIEEFKNILGKDITLIENIIEIEKFKNLFIILKNNINNLENKANFILKKYKNENNKKKKIINKLSEKNLRLLNLIDDIRDGKSPEISHLFLNYENEKNKNYNKATLLNNQIIENKNKIYILENLKSYEPIINDIDFSLNSIISYLDKIIQNDDYQEIISSFNKTKWIDNSTINQINNYDALIKTIINNK